jgi:putative hydrolase of the HAD superfamily
MAAERRAVLFDLDDTLYPRRRFVLSGLAAVAVRLSASHGIAAAQAFRAMTGAMRRGGHGREMQTCLDQLGLSPALVPELVAIVRTHRPRLRLPVATRRALSTLGPGWRLGIVTNGLPSVQANKVEALGLDGLVDTVVYAAEQGTGAGKPDIAPFDVALRRLDVAPRRAVYVGDSEECDIAGASCAGLRTVLLRPRADRSGTAADAVVRSVAEVPRIAELLIEPGPSRRWPGAAPSRPGRDGGGRRGEGLDPCGQETPWLRTA